MCKHAEGHGKHQAGAVETGVAEARFQFPAAPYNLTLQISNRAFVQADFAPTKDAPSNNAPRYTFRGEVPISALDFADLEVLLRNFAEWGRGHSQRRPEAQPLEQTVAFRTLKRMLPTELHTQ